MVTAPAALVTSVDASRLDAMSAAVAWHYSYHGLHAVLCVSVQTPTVLHSCCVWCPSACILTVAAQR